METKIIKIDRQSPDASAVRAASEAINAGGVVVFPTDTVYGMAAGAFYADTQKRIYELKGRSERKPLILMSPDVPTLECLVEITDRVRRIMDTFWPGPLTLVLPTTELGKMVMGGRTDVGVRIPDDNVVRAVLNTCGCPLATTSANPSSEESAKCGDDAARYFAGQVDLILDAGPCAVGRESTVVDMTHFHCVVVREGALPSKKLLEYLW